MCVVTASISCAPHVLPALQHKGTNMVDLVNRQCSRPGCTRRAAYGLTGQAAMWCATHKVIHMRNTTSICALHECIFASRS
jgi:hypothetical protein